MNFYVFVADAEIGHAKVEELQHQQNLSDDLAAESVTSTAVVKNNMNEDDSKTSYSSDIPVCLISVLFCIALHDYEFQMFGKILESKGTL